MKILHVIPKLPINRNFTVIGGSANSLINLSRQQKISGDSVNILSYFPLLDGNDGQFLTENGFKNIHINSSPNSNRYGAEFIYRSTAFALTRRNQYEILHGHSGHIDYLIASLLSSRIINSRLVYSLYCPLSLESRITRYPLRKKYLDLVAKHVKFIAISENIARSLTQLTDRENIKVIPPPINIQRYSSEYQKEELRHRYSFEPNQPVILFVGNFSKTKNMEYVLIAFKKFLRIYPFARLIITTELPMAKFSERENYLKNLIQELNISQNLVFLGVIDNMPELMQLSDVLVAPFRDTDGPSDYFLAALEAMSVGTPVFVSPAGGMKEVVNESNGMLIDPDQPDDLYTRLVDFFSNDSTSNEMAINAAKCIRQKFAPELIEQKIKEVYMEILQK